MRCHTLAVCSIHCTNFVQVAPGMMLEFMISMFGAIASAGLCMLMVACKKYVLVRSLC
jgi:hypothetical protein